ncbi:O-antigen ligase family protein [Sphingobacterium thalpophilum]|uniref:O-antigen ligase family protein n=1 Tax=Sphingobacterium thalpophilum TaxID=259 RepID=UPI003D99C8B9
MDKFLVRFISFFSYTGFYIGVTLLLAIGLGDFTRFYSIPIRAVLCFAMVLFFLMYRNKKLSSKGTYTHIFIFLFWIIYLIKVYSDIVFPNLIPYSKTAYEIGFYTLSYCVIPFIMFKSVDLSKYSKIILDTMILAGFVLGILSIVLYRDIILSGNIGRINQARYLGFDTVTINPLILAYTSSLTIGFVLFKFSVDGPKSKSKLFYYCSVLIVSIILLLLGASRGAFISLAVTIIMLFIYGDAKLRKRLGIVFFITLPILLWASVKIGSSFLARMNTLGDVDNDNSATSRFTFWSDALNEFANFPFAGGKLEVSGIYPHNIFIETLMATGFLGAVPFFIFVILCTKKGIQISKLNKQYLWIFIFFLQALIHYSFTESIYLANALFIPAGLLCSVHFTKLNHK